MGKKDKSSSKDDDAKHEQKFQAVLLADSFVNSFRPISLDKPKVLCPLNNVVMLDYAMEFIAGAGVEELFVVCTSNEVEDYVSQNTWSNTTVKVTCILDSSLTNAGDALRELDKRNLVQSDPFLLLFGDTITNVNIGPALEAHRERRKKDSSAIMTCFFKPVGAWDCKEADVEDDDEKKVEEDKAVYCPLRPANDDLVVALGRDNRILVYDNHSSRQTTSIPCSFFAAHPQADFRADLLDCGIDICSPDVLARFSDEFDYRDIRQEFVTNLVAEEEEGLQSKIYAHMLGPSEYAARVHDFNTYAAVSQDLLRRWCYPVVPDNLPSGYEKDQHYVVERRFHYRERKGRSKIGRSTVMSGPGMIGSHCSVGDHCLIERTIIGSECCIGDHVTLKDSFLWGKVTVEDGATLVRAVLAEGCVVKRGATVSSGCVLGPNVVIGNGVSVPEMTRVTTSNKSDEDDFDDDDDFGDFNDDDDEDDDDKENNEKVENEDVLVTDHDVVGQDGVGKVWKPLEDDDDDDDDDDEDREMSPLELMKAQSIGFNRLPLLQRRKERQKVQDENHEDPGTDGKDDDDGMGDFEYGTSTFAADTEHIVGRQKGIDVVKELKTICMEHEESSPWENLAIELNSFKFSQNATYSDCTKAATLAILERMQLTPDTKARTLVASLKAKLDHWGSLLEKMSIGLDEEKAIIHGIESAANENNDLGNTLQAQPNFRIILQTLHDQEVLSEEAILAWAAERKEEEDSDSVQAKLFAQEPTQDFLEWLEDEDDENDEDEDDEDD